MGEPRLEPLLTPPPHEVAVGLERYSTRTPGTGGRLKMYAEDFVVEEVPLPIRPVRGEGKYTIAAVRARNWETNRLMQELAKSLHVSPRSLFFAGTKDKRAVTTQYVAIPAPRERVEALRLKDVEILHTTRADRAPKIGELSGNRFEIAIRHMGVPAAEAAARARAILAELDAAEGPREADSPLPGFPNWFGVQRFGVQRPVTHVVGRCLVRGDVEAAVRTYVANPIEGEEEQSFEARARFEMENDPAAALEYYPRHLSFERSMLRAMHEHPEDPAAPLLALPRNLLTMFVYAYQSLLFNRIIARRLAEGLPVNEPVEGDICVGAKPDGAPDRDTVVPVDARNLEKVRRQARRGRAFVTAVLFGAEVGFAQGRPGEIERAVIEEEGVSAEAFRVPALPEAASRGMRRELFCPLSDVGVESGEDEHGEKLVMKFFLPKGAYATCLLREVVKSAGVS